MVGQGSGPSRRSHTKSRKGCKTCKRRHIRCDETFPQCRNCTKHQVRCDYLEQASPDSESQPSPEQPAVMLTPTSESRVDLWQQTGGFPFPELDVYPPPQMQEYSKDELRLIEHLSSISNDLLLNGTSNLTIWSQKLPKFLSIASSYPYVMHALLSFSANHLAWLHGSPNTRNLHIQHGGIALGGLHEAINSFSSANADAVLAASLLMLWQATDWRSWSSLRAGIQSILSAMQSWKHESIFTEYVVEEDLVADAFRTHRRQPSVNISERGTVLQSIVQALQRLQIGLAGQESELYWTNQLLTYVQRLQTLDAAKTPEEQFCQFYYLRKWLFWVPISLLRRQGNHGPALLTLAHFYATALALDPLFPDLGTSFCSALALPPLDSIIRVTDAMQSQQASAPIAQLMQFPRQAAYNYRNFAAQTVQQPLLQQPTPIRTPSDAWTYPTIGNLSPAFAPLTPAHYVASTPQSAASVASSSSQQSGWLEVPGANPGFGYGTQSWGMASPAFPSMSNMPDVDDQQLLYGYGGMQPGSGGGFRGGWVQPSSVWT